MSAASGQLLPVSSSDSASFLTRLRHSSSMPASSAIQFALLRSNSKVSSSVQFGSVFSSAIAWLMRSRLRCWKRAKIT